MNSIPTDLVVDIFFRLPPKSIARCRCVSRLWWSMLHSPDFTEFFRTRSMACPRISLLMDDFQHGQMIFFSLPQPHNSYEKLSSIVVASAAETMKLHLNGWQEICGHASGLFCFCYYPPLSSNDDYIKHVICNPSTGQCEILPKLRRSIIIRESLLGYDPIDKQFKLLLLAYPGSRKRADHRIMTLGTGNMRWRKIQCPLPHTPPRTGHNICINGVLYYLATTDVTDENFDDLFSPVIVCFNVRSEEFKFIDAKSFSHLINYNGKLCGVKYKLNDDCTFEAFELCVLEDVEKQEWSTYVYILPENKIVEWKLVSIAVVGLTATGEIVLSSEYSSVSKPFYVFYFNPIKNTLQSVEIRGFEEYHKKEVFDRNYRVYAYVDHADDPRFDLKKKIYAAVSSKPHLLQDGHTFQSINKFNALRLLDDIDDEFTGCPLLRKSTKYSI